MACRRESTYYETAAFSEVPKQRDEITSGCLTLAFSGAQKGAEVLHNHCILGCPQTRGKNPKRLPRPYLLGGPQEDGNATYTLQSRGSPNKGT